MYWGGKCAENGHPTMLLCCHDPFESKPTKEHNIKILIQTGDGFLS